MEKENTEECVSDSKESVDPKKINKTKKIISMTKNNYAIMLKRLKRKSKFANNILIYYSLALIVFSLTAKYFNQFNRTYAEYIGILLSTVVLVYSLINNNANYQIRIIRIEEALNHTKKLQRELTPEIKMSQYKKIVDDYEDVTKCTEIRADVDFFINVKSMCKKYNVNILTKKKRDCNESDIRKIIEDDERDQNIRVINDYLSELNIFLLIASIVFDYIRELIIYILPVGIFILLFFI